MEVCDNIVLGLFPSVFYVVKIYCTFIVGLATNIACLFGREQVLQYVIKAYARPSMIQRQEVETGSS